MTILHNVVKIWHSIYQKTIELYNFETEQTWHQALLWIRVS